MVYYCFTHINLYFYWNLFESPLVKNPLVAPAINKGSQLYTCIVLLFFRFGANLSTAICSHCSHQVPLLKKSWGTSGTFARKRCELPLSDPGTCPNGREEPGLGRLGWLVCSWQSTQNREDYYMCFFLKFFSLGKKKNQTIFSYPVFQVYR